MVKKKPRNPDDIMAECLLRGGKMLRKACRTCGAPLFEVKGETLCVVCRETGKEPGKGAAPPAAPPDAAASGAGAGAGVPAAGEETDEEKELRISIGVLA